MRDWEQYVSSHLPPSDLAVDREARIVGELASQLEDFYREARTRGDSEADADAYARSQIADWKGLAASIRQADGARLGSPLARWSDRLDDQERAGSSRSAAFANLWRELRYVGRQLGRRPGFAAIAILTLALGLGAHTAIFTVVYGVLLKPLPFKEAERLVGVYHAAPSLNVPVVNHGPATYFTYREHQRVFEEIGAWESDEASITGRGEPEQVEVLTVTHTLLPLLRVQPAHGRLFIAEDDTPGSPVRIVLSDRYWRRKFQGDPAIVGQSLRVDGTPAQVIGVLPPSFRFLQRHPDVLLPMRLDPAAAFSGMMFDFQVIGRLKPGGMLTQANADLARMIPLLPKPHDTLGLQPNVRPLAEDVVGDIRRVLWILLAAVGVVLLIACANVANLFLVRAEGRQQELAVRAALGASRGRLARELLTESVLLSLAAGVLGLLLTHAAIGVLRTLAPAELPRVDEISVDPVVLLVALALSLVTGAVFGVLPVARFGSLDGAVLRENGRTVSEAPSRHRTRNLLVVAEVALAIVLLVVSGLMIRTFVAMRQVDPGFVRPELVQTFRVAVPEALIPDEGQVARTHEDILARLRNVPGVVSAGLSSSITMDGEDNTNPLFAEHVFVPEGAWPPLRRFKSVAPGYFETMGNPLLAGRAISWSDIHERRRVVIVSETLARELWQSAGGALGKRVRNNRSSEWYQIVGVVGNERDDGLNKPATAIVYWPLLSDAYHARTLAYAVRSDRVGQAGFLRDLQQAVWAVNPNLPLASVQTLGDIQKGSMAQTSFTMLMLGIAAAVALLLGSVGLYAVIAYAVARRTREIGIRMALGARAADVLRMLLAHGMTLTGLGIAIGVVAALGTTRVIAALLYDTSPTDALTFLVVTLLVGATALIACSLPARKAMQADPTATLRYE
jgi:putative ABC transport system permease protein